MFSSFSDYSGNRSATNGNSSENLACQMGYEGCIGNSNCTHQSVDSAFLIFLSLKKAIHSDPLSLLLRFHVEVLYNLS